MSAPAGRPGAPAASLPRVFGAFFGRFARLTDVQERAIPAIVAGDDVLVCAPTGTGKTEAYTAPVVERLLGTRVDGLHFLVVSPTRALANDLYRRLAPVLDALAVPFGRYTGEHKERPGGRLPTVAVATPEALDSLLARRPHVLRAVAAVALDEIHVLDGTARGDQLRVLLHRLDAATETPPQRVAASATVPDPEGLAGRYLRAARLVLAGGGRAIRARAFAGRTPADFARHLDALAAANFRKILVFTNSRQGVEALAAGLRGATRFGAAVYPHHGSLARRERERTERRFLEAPAAVAVATLTLELGIDIGSVDYVLLDGPPPSVASLLQRIGRGGRRSDGPTRAGYAFADEAERRFFRTLFARAADGDLCADATDFRPGVLVQQALVLAGGAGVVTAATLSDALPPELRPRLPDPATVLAAMVEHELLERPLVGRHVLAPRTERAYDAGRLHGNIDAEPGTDVVDRLTGEVVGRVAPTAKVEGERLQLGGRAHRPVREVDGRLLVDASAEGAPARFASRSAPALAFALARAFAADLGAAPDELIQGRVGATTVLLHGLGALGGPFLAALVTARHGADAVVESTPMTLHLARPLVELPRPAADDVDRHVRRHERALARRLGMGPYHRRLPLEARVTAVRRASPLDRVASFLGDARLTTRSPDEALPDVFGAV